MHHAVLDDRNLYYTALIMWRQFTPSYIYLASDGPRPRAFPSDRSTTPEAQECYWIHWNSAGCLARPMLFPEPRLKYQNGQSVEACRDMWHAGAGIGGLINAAETASIQGDDLYGEEKERLMAGVSYLVQINQEFPEKGYPNGFCAGALRYELPGLNGEVFPSAPAAMPSLSDIVAYNHYATEEGLRFPTLKIPGYDRRYPGGDPVASYISENQTGPHDVNGLVSSWTILTHYGVGQGIPPTAAPMPAPKPPAPSPSPSPSSGVASSTPSPAPTAEHDHRSQSSADGGTLPSYQGWVALAGAVVSLFAAWFLWLRGRAFRRARRALRRPR